MSADTHTGQEAAELTVGDPFLWYAAAARFAEGLGGKRYTVVNVHHLPPGVFEQVDLDEVDLIHHDGEHWLYGRKSFGPVGVNLYSTHDRDEITATYARLVAAGKAES